MQTTLFAVGRLRPAWREACDEYLARLRRYDRFDERELKEGPGTAPAERVRREGERLLAAMPDACTVVALDRGGEPWSSDVLARRLDGWRVESRPLALVIGGAHGLAPPVLERARHRWSLGPLTLTHQLARVIVLEQWYRAWSILRGEPYHK